MIHIVKCEGRNKHILLIHQFRYTEHTPVSLAQQWDQLRQMVMRIRHNLEQQIQARNMTGVTEEQLREFTSSFRSAFTARFHLRHPHFGCAQEQCWRLCCLCSWLICWCRYFDKDQNGKLEHHEFKACLRSQGYELQVLDQGQTDPQFEAILDQVDPNRLVTRKVSSCSVNVTLVWTKNISSVCYNCCASLDTVFARCALPMIAHNKVWQKWWWCNYIWNWSQGYIWIDPFIKWAMFTVSMFLLTGLATSPSKITCPSWSTKKLITFDLSLRLERPSEPLQPIGTSRLSPRKSYIRCVE